MASTNATNGEPKYKIGLSETFPYFLGIPDFHIAYELL
jgi:hypothetical protein